MSEGDRIMRNENTTLTGCSKKASIALWTIQGLLAALFLFAGGMKLVMPAAALAQQSGLPAAFMKFIGACELAGALGLILPGLLGIRRGLTPLAAAGLVIIMVGAVTLTLGRGQVGGAVLPFVVGVLAALVAHQRWQPPRTHRAAPPRLTTPHAA